MNCPTCHAQSQRYGRNRRGQQRYHCLACNITFTEERPRPLGRMSLAEDRALMCLNLLVEGNSIRSTERITGVHRDTILALLITVGDRCERLMENRIQGISVRDVQCDEIWGFVLMKEKRKASRGIEDNRLGDAYCFIAIERYTKLILAWHLGRRSMPDTFAFTEKLARATADHNFQISTDGFPAYRDAIVHSLGAKHVDFAQIIKVFGKPSDDDRKYSPPEVIDCEKMVIFGNPDMDQVCTSHIERQNLTARMSMRRMTRLTNAFSKKWLNHKAAYALYFAHYNFCRVHSTLRVTPAMESGLSSHIWTLSELLQTGE